MSASTDESRLAAFTRIFHENVWGSPESHSGLGSNFGLTSRVRFVLPMLLRGLKITSMIDAPCGDFNWMHHVDLGETRYLGCDIVEDIIAINRSRFPGREFRVLDLVNDVLPQVDLIFSRDCLQHLVADDIRQALRNFRRSGAKWLFTSSHTTAQQDIALEAGGFGFLNLQLPPFSLPLPLLTMPEDHYASKAMHLWDLAQIET